MWKYIFDYGYDKSGRLDPPGIGVGGTVIKYLQSTDEYNCAKHIKSWPYGVHRHLLIWLVLRY